MPPLAPTSSALLLQPPAADRTRVLVRKYDDDGFAVAFAAICIDLPPTLRHLELDGVLRRAAPTFTSALLNAVEAPHILPQLERLGVRLDWCPEELVEAAEGGRQLQIDLSLLGPACAQRGIRCDIEVDWPSSSSA